jgi:hypothetical protein
MVCPYMGTPVKNAKDCWAWWFMPVIPVGGGDRKIKV